MEQRKPQLTSNQLKLIALVSMTIDHLGYFLFPDLRFLRIIGRIAFPIFAFMIGEGCRHTSNRLRYFLTVFGIGIVIQVFFWFTRHSLYQHILITFSMSILLISCLRMAAEKGGAWMAVAGLVLAAEAFICLLLRQYLPRKGFGVDYSLCGVLLPVLVYSAQTRTQKLLAAAIGLTAVCMYIGGIQWYSLLALPLLALYRGQRGTHRLKYLFYAYYPLHLFLIEGIRVTYMR